MYHIKNDKRAQASSELICAGLLACMKEKPFARITITDVQRASSVSRSTFYRNFDCLEDVLALLCDRGFQAVFAARSALPPGAARQSGQGCVSILVLQQHSARGTRGDPPDGHFV